MATKTHFGTTCENWKLWSKRVWSVEIASKMNTCQQPKRPQNCPKFPDPQFQIDTASGKDEWDLQPTRFPVHETFKPTPQI